MTAPITVMIVDDDPVVAVALRAQVQRVPGFTVVAVADTGQRALLAARHFAPRLVLLDLSLPDAHGLEVAHRLRGRGFRPTDVIVVTGRQEIETVRAAMRQGALHYLVKPIRGATVDKVLTRYAASVRQAADGGRASGQQEIDAMFASLHRDDGGTVGRPAIPAAATPQTVGAVLTALSQAQTDLSASETAELVGVSRATARRYLETLVAQGQVVASLRYGALGRPQHRYRIAP
jgi:response regulator of citrate/malate metabolism